MAPIQKKRLLLLCGASILGLQLAILPVDLDNLRPTTKMAQAQESCFTAGTMILMSDGSQRPIETIAAGDQVMGRRGRVNAVKACERTVLGDRRLYALNGGRLFVTAEHPFLTVEGWKALDPEATRRENAALDVGALQIGDQLCRGTVRLVGGERRSAPADPGVLFVQATAALEALAAVSAAPETPLFNLLLDGDHSYVADGWIVHNKDGDIGGPAGGMPADGPADYASPPSNLRGGTAPAPSGQHSGSNRGLGSVAPQGDEPVADFLSDLGMRDPDEAGLRPKSGALTREQEEGLISRGWLPRD
jgi:hypothetical protein